MAVSDYVEPQTHIREASGNAKDSLVVVTDYESLTEAFGKEYNTESLHDDEELEHGRIRVFTSGGPATVYFFPGEELKDQELVYGLKNDDAEVSQNYREVLDPVTELFGGEERVGELLEKAD